MHPAGYDALLADAGAYEDAGRLVLRVHGDRALAALHGLVTADLTSMTGDAAWPSLVLTPKGRVLADAVIVSCGGEVLLDVPRAAWSELEPHFARYLPPRLARLEPSELRVVRIRGPGALGRERNDAALASLDGPVASERDGSRWDAVAYRGGVATRPPESLVLYLPPGETLGFDIATVSDEAWEVWRIERGIPLYGVDMSQENLPQETGLVVERVSFVKGCYTGQEVLARIHYRGKVNRFLRGLRAMDGGDGGSGGDGPARLAAGDVVISNGKEIGTVSSAARSPLLGWIALATVRREVGPGDTVELRRPERTDHVTARVTDLPIPSE